MRIIGGSHKGKSINPPLNYEARPTTDFAKEGLFNILVNEFNLSECRVLDLFSGTGGISLEFASRGVSEIYSVEMNPKNAAFIKRTATGFGFKGINVVRHNVFDFIDICKIDVDIIFADPPYFKEGIENIPDKILERRVTEDGKSILREGGRLILEHSADYSFTSHPRFIKEKKYGNVHFSFFG